MNKATVEALYPFVVSRLTEAERRMIAEKNSRLLFVNQKELAVSLIAKVSLIIEILSKYDPSVYKYERKPTN